MNHELKENFFNFVNAVENTAKLSVIEEINKRLWSKLKAYNNLLDSSEACHIYLNTYGKKSERMRELRNSLRAKKLLIEEIAGMIYDIKDNETPNKNQ